MHVVWRADIHCVNIVSGNQLLPVCFVGSIVPALHKGLGIGFSSGAAGLQYRAVLVFRKKVSQALVAIGVDSPHQPCADETYAN